ncbi:MAG: hypothetical protein ABIC68_06310 [Candidatus Omnitrophota bacterium]
MAELVNQDNEHLKYLTIGHYVVGILGGLFSCVFIIHLVIGIIALTSPQLMADKGGQVPPPFFGWIFVIMGGAALLFGWGYAVCMIIAGRSLARRKRYIFCMVMAGLSCLFIPFGTLVGVFAIIVLSRPTVKEMFEQKS